MECGSVLLCRFCFCWFLLLSLQRQNGAKTEQNTRNKSGRAKHCRTPNKGKSRDEWLLQFPRESVTIAQAYLFSSSSEITMPAFRCWLCALLMGCLLPCFAVAQEKKTPIPPDSKTVEQIAADAKESIAVLLYTGRDGKKQGLGTGFVISEDGLIATNLHEIGR